MTFERIKALYEQGKITDKALDVYVKKGIITEEQARQIRGE